MDARQSLQFWEEVKQWWCLDRWFCRIQFRIALLGRSLSESRKHRKPFQIRTAAWLKTNYLIKKKLKNIVKALQWRVSIRFALRSPLHLRRWHRASRGSFFSRFPVEARSALKCGWTVKAPTQTLRWIQLKNGLKESRSWCDAFYRPKWEQTLKPKSVGTLVFTLCFDSLAVIKGNRSLIESGECRHSRLTPSTLE